MRTLAIIGSGPAGFYTAEAALKAMGEHVRIDIIDRLPTPYGLIRAGVAPDHQSIKAVSRRYDQVAADPRVRFLGNVAIGTDISATELTGIYDDVVLAVGAPQDRPLGVPGAELPGVVGSAAFVGWYNGHPDFRDLAPPLGVESAVVVGNGNVAIDCARILAKTVAELQDSDIVNHALDPLAQSKVRRVHVLGRRGPHQASFTLKEVGELGELARATPLVRAADFPPAEEDGWLDSGQRRVVEVLRKFAAAGPDAAKPVTISLDFFRRPLRVIGRSHVEALEVMKTRLDEDGQAIDTGETETIPCGLVVAAIGYRSTPIPGVPFDETAGRFVNVDGLIAPGLWCVGWARRGPSGTIGTNRPDGFALVERIAATPVAGGKPGRAGIDALLAARGVQVADFADWQMIDALEVSRARTGAPREKIVALEELRAVFAG
ncbi:pyridine nucleotide-disulfide oxidoreductase [Sandaracinobacter neustonicus]|uniref:Pyridine nucleotide-disulfide oxidoreductase n=1 Tax=Sandaracinobacter neustonicus TaxID=1715348 RepID=A0A501XLU0_9SPHN|nr:FAD-dependent oxidoreductase [Sandaracinobacter neustonicus]TPE61147.1 pyridine nucleotide-disulfide oxidoreductase [Sandaracinobacter neustonicus]